MNSLKILLEMRPALDGHAGIPQETRLLFRGLRTLDGIDAEGLIQSSGHVLGKGLPTGSTAGTSTTLPIDQQLNRLSKTVISLQQSVGSPFLAAYFMLLKHIVGGDQQLTKFDATHFQDFIWRALFARTLPYDDFATVTHANFRIAQVPWTAMHRAALITKMLGYPVYPRLNTADFDVMIAETPYPARVSGNTTLVVRYHDAIPILMPHTISDKRYHQASHYHALRCNVSSGAHFACVSDATRRDLISIFPQAEARAVTIHNMVSHHYFAEESNADRVPEIIRNRLNVSSEIRKVAHQAKNIDELGREGTVDYLLMVSTIEPRKNHQTLLSAWELLKTERFPNLKLVIVGMLGWHHESIIKKFQPWLERGQLFMLEDVPAAELRVLYRHARATVCPSFGEGFDFSGVEAMRCGGAVAASDIGVHREIYDDAAEFFSPYSVTAAADAIAHVIDTDSVRRQDLVIRGATVAARYAPEKILPVWQQYLMTLNTQKAHVD